MRDYGSAILERFGFVSALLRTYTDDLETASDMNSFLIVVDLVSCCKGPHGYQELVTDLLKIVENQENTFLNGIE